VELNLGLMLIDIGKANETLKWVQRAYESNEPGIKERADAAIDSLLRASNPR